MNVQQIQTNTKFEAKQRRFIDWESQDQLTQILRKMDKETEYKSNEYSFESTKMTRLKLIDDKKKVLAELVDTRQNLKPLVEGKDLYNNTLLTIGKTELVIDNKSGEIIDYYKPFFQTWKGVMKKISNTLLDFNNCFYSKVVKKYKLGISGLTKKGAKILDKIKIK